MRPLLNQFSLKKRHNRTSGGNEKKQKRLVRKVNRVPIKLMAQIQRGDLRGTNAYERGLLGTKEIKRCEERALDEWDIHNFYSEEHIQEYISDLVKGRQEFTEEIASEGLRPEIIYAAERSFRISRDGKKAGLAVPGTAEIEYEERPVFTWESKSRPRRERLWHGR